MEWTKPQREAIEYSGENILLAAAAGSGKTAVLVQRVIELICDRKHNTDVNRLLVLTFTDAAAREMREKILDAIERVLQQNPDDRHLQRQKLLIHSASISTIHSFCLNLLKNNINMTDLPANFSLISETENKIMVSESLEYVFEKFYGKIGIDSSIADLVMGYGGIKNDSALRETVLGLFYFSKSMTYPAKWLNEAIRKYKKTAKSGCIDDVWTTELSKIVKEAQSDLTDIYSQILEIIENKLDLKHPYAAFFAGEKAAIECFFNYVSDKGYDETRVEFLNFSFEKLVSGPRLSESEVLAAQNQIKALRELAKGIFDDLKRLFKVDEGKLIERIKQTYPRLRTLKNIVLMLDRVYTKRKREKNFLDFNDLEHEALRLLIDKDLKPTQTAMELREKYTEILVDEYQDTNNIQDTLFRAVSRNNENIFMVGDLKQSIYSFRNAVPKLFADKYAEYGTDKGNGHLIRLFKNFRSRDRVVDVVNFIFGCVMSPRVGGIDYTEEEYLINGAEYPNPQNKTDFDTEFHLICSNAEEDNATGRLDKNALEAYVAASRIRDMVDRKMPIFDKKIGSMRPVEFRDIVVLMRNTKTPAPIFERVFEECDIPVYSEIGRSYLASPEVQTVLAFLQIIDNPRQAIPLIAVMRSPVWGFSTDELAQIRIEKRSGYFYEAVLTAAQNGNAKAANFVGQLESLRKKAEYWDVERLLREIYREFGVYAYLGSLNRGAECRANLRLLLERAAEFGHTQLSGLFSFMNYIDTIKKQGDDLTPAKILGDGDNVVRIMTIHKSKGLEFPIVILSDTTRSFNTADIKKNILWNSESGIAADFADTKMRVRYPAMPKDLAARQAKRELMSEEMRLLYVALTRAREKLIITSTFKKTKKGLALPLYNKDKSAKAAYISSKLCFRDWLMAAFLTHPSFENIREYFGFSEDICNRDAKFGLEGFLYESSSEIPPCGYDAVTMENSVETGENYSDKEVEDRLSYEYPEGYLGKVPVKLSVSEVKRMQSEEDDFVPVLDELRVNELSTLEVVKGAQKGTVVHFVMQIADPASIASVSDVEALLERLLEEKTLTKAQAKAVDAKKVYGFFASRLGQRLKAATRLEREFSFYTTAKISEIYQNDKPGDILLQGTMDCFFVENDGNVVLIDFKTDQVRSKADAVSAAGRYAVQMKYYKKALAEILERPVDECYLYFLECGEMVEV